MIKFVNVETPLAVMQGKMLSKRSFVQEEGEHIVKPVVKTVCQFASKINHIQMFMPVFLILKNNENDPHVQSQRCV